MSHINYKEQNYYVKDGVLNLSNIGIRDIIEIEGLETLKDLDTLYLYGNQISEIHKLENLTSLERLSLRNNKITEIKGLDKLTNLKQVYLENNQITEIKGLENLRNLETLNLNNNQIFEIKGLKNLRNLQQFSLKNNLIPEDLLDALGGLYSDGSAKKPQKFIEYCQKQNKHQNKEKDSSQIKKVLIYVIYATKDSDYFQIPIIAENLTNKPEIEDVLYWEEDMKEDIFKYMNDNVGKCDMCIIFCSQNAHNSKAVEMEWQSALKLDKKMIPVFNNEEDIPPLLTTKLGVKFDKDDLNGVIKDIYSQILKRLNISNNKYEKSITSENDNLNEILDAFEKICDFCIKHKNKEFIEVNERTDLIFEVILLNKKSEEVDKLGIIISGNWSNNQAESNIYIHTKNKLQIQLVQHDYGKVKKAEIKLNNQKINNKDEIIPILNELRQIIKNRI